MGTFDAFYYCSCSVQGMYITQWVRIRVLLPLFTGHILFIRIEFLILGTTFRNKERNPGLFRRCPLGCWTDSLMKAWLIMRVGTKTISLRRWREKRETEVYLCRKPAGRVSRPGWSPPSPAGRPSTPAACSGKPRPMGLHSGIEQP